MGSKQTVFVVDDDPAIRDALSLFLDSRGFNVASFESASAFLDGYHTAEPCCLLLDIRMPGMDGIELQETMAARQIRIPIIFITGHGDIPMAVRAIKKGACDFIEKPFDNSALLKRIESALKLSEQDHRLYTKQSHILGLYNQLTPREQEVMALVANGLPNKQIAQKLYISHRTVEIHRRRVMSKMRATSISELISMAIACSVYDDPLQQASEKQGT
jgi:FixJ family two-component response regulator